MPRARPGPLIVHPCSAAPQLCAPCWPHSPHSSCQSPSFCSDGLLEAVCSGSLTTTVDLLSSLQEPSWLCAEPANAPLPGLTGDSRTPELHSTQLLSGSCLVKGKAGAASKRLIQCHQAHLDREVGSLGLVLPDSVVSALTAEGVGLAVPCLRSPTGGGDTEGDLAAIVRVRSQRRRWCKARLSEDG